MADTVILKNGDQFSGRLLPRKGTQLQIKTEYTGNIKVDWIHVKEIILDEPAFLTLDTGESVRVIDLKAEEDKIYYTDPGGKDHKVDATGIVGIDTEAWVKNEEFIFSGIANISVKSERGNSDAEFADLDFDLEFQRKDDRVRITGELEKDIKTREFRQGRDHQGRMENRG